MNRCCNCSDLTICVAEAAFSTNRAGPAFDSKGLLLCRFGIDPHFLAWGDLIVAKKGTGFFDRKGHFFKTARAATESDLAALLGQIGEGESLAPGIAHMLLDRRDEIERLFAEHDAMMAEDAGEDGQAFKGTNVAKLPEREAS